MRLLIGTVGVLVGGYGAYLLLTRQDNDQLVSAAVWLGGGVLLHDFVLSALVLAVAALGLRVLPSGARAPAAVGLIVLGTMTVAAFPVLGRFGAISDNSTHLDRPYLAAWGGLVAVVLLTVVVASLLRVRRPRGDVAEEAG